MSEVSRPGPRLRFSGPQLTPSVRQFLADEAGGAAVLLAATVIALVWANSPWSASYFSLWDTVTSVQVGDMRLELDLQHVINDMAMAIFFLVLGLEINREITTGQLRDRRSVLVPTLGAAGGMVVPIALYLAINHGGPGGHGWGIVMSTDTAFVLGVLALFGPRCPDQLRLFLLTLSVVDDIGAISVMAIFYTNSVRIMAIILAVLCVAAIVVMRWLGVWRLTPYVLAAIGLWCAVYASGVQPTLAGVLVGLLVPATPVRHEQVNRLRIYGRALVEEPTASRSRLTVLAAAAAVPPSERMQRSLHPWSSYAVVPAFGLANAGVHLSEPLLRSASSSPISIGIVVGLVVGKTVGVTTGSAIALRTRLGVLPGRVRYGHLVGGAILAGIGFTISLFITDLAFPSATLRDEAKIGILAGSLLAAVLGALAVRVMGERSPLCSPDSDQAPVSLPPLPWT